MTAEPTPEPDISRPSGDVFDIAWPKETAGRLIFASPHSGGHSPDDMRPAAGLSPLTLRSAEDVAVDRLIAVGADHGVPVLTARISRAYLDLNRSPSELDPVLIEDVPAAEPTGKVAAGFGVVPRRAGDGTSLYDRRLSLDEAGRRIARVHVPYHAALAGLLTEARDRHGTALLVDWHSMPSRAAGVPTRGQRSVDIILGDRHGAACRSATSRRARALFEAQGWRVGLNAPYAGGYATQHWGRPGAGFEALQVEINRALYLDERTLEPSAAYEGFKAALAAVIAGLAGDLGR
ncbi:hypothetical protein MMB232_00735 [Brevundimonas subvibrioides]|uniref:N-formylglutamate amidohydrolase n=1 Tax=Brevundimonas subvibrioides TaxID=74313 RepID=UPI0032D57F27